IYELPDHLEYILRLYKSHLRFQLESISVFHLIMLRWMEVTLNNLLYPPLSVVIDCHSKYYFLPYCGVDCTQYSSSILPSKSSNDAFHFFCAILIRFSTKSLLASRYPAVVAILECPNNLLSARISTPDSAKSVAKACLNW